MKTSSFFFAMHPSYFICRRWYTILEIISMCVDTAIEIVMNISTQQGLLDKSENLQFFSLDIFENAKEPSFGNSGNLLLPNKISMLKRLNGRY